MKKKLRYIVFLLLSLQAVVYGQLSGSYIISTSSPDGPNFNTLASAVTYLTAQGMSGPVTFLIDENQTGISSTIEIGSIAGASATNTLTIRPNDGKTITIQGALGAATGNVRGLIEFTNASYVTIDGNNGTSDNNLTIFNSYNQFDWAHSVVLWLKDGTHHCSVQNLSIQSSNRTIGTQNGYVLAGILGSGSLTGIGAAYTDVARTNFITINNVQFLDAKSPLLVNGDATTSDWTITNCTISNSGPLGIKPIFGMELFNVNNYTVSKNSISNIEKFDNNTIAAAGISIRGTSSNGVVSNNRIYSIKNNLANNGSYSGGIIVFSAGGGVGNVSIYNNMISDITNASNDDNDNFNFHNKGHGIIIRGSNVSPVANNGLVNIWHNTILIESLTSGGRNSCLYVEENSNSTLDVRNNIFTNRSPTGTQYAVLIPGVNLPIITRMNYNAYYVSNESTNNFRNRRGDTEYLTPMSWDAACGDPESSFSSVNNPTYISTTDLHLVKEVANSLLAINSDTSITQVATDIDGDSRTKPYRGADEAFICSQSSVWNGSSWSLPLQNDTNLIFQGNYSENVDIAGCNCTVRNGATVTIPSDRIMNIQEKVTVETGGSLVFENNSSLVQSDNILNSGSIIYKRTTPTIKDFDYVYWGSPVQGQVLNVLSPLTDKYWSWDAGAWKAEAGSNTMEVPKGYIIRVPRYVTSQTVQFEGIPNNGDITITSQGVDQNNLIGNPYPSAISADAFITANSSVVAGALYFWTHNTQRTINGGGTAMVYASNDYATYTLTGGTGTGAPAGSGGATPAGYIAAGQSFFVGSLTTGNFVFNNTMRSKVSGNNSQFFRQTATKKEAQAEKNRIWLNLTNDEGAFKQLLVGYVKGATNEKDRLYDGVSNNGNQFIDFYSLANSEKYSVQGRALPFATTDKVPLGYKSTIEGTLKIGIDKVDGLFVGNKVYLVDKKSNVFHDLTKGVYSFTTAIGTFDDRFEMVYLNRNEVQLPPIIDSFQSLIDKFLEYSKSVIVSVKNHQIRINAFDREMTKVIIFDLRGRKVFDSGAIKNNDYIVSDLKLKDQILVVSVQLSDGKKATKTVIYKK